MQLINQHTKAIMERCKEQALAAGLKFAPETLEYVVTNRDLLELSPKIMIPTLYDYWVHDVDVLREKGKYELYPHNPYETVINTRPAISFYNDNNPDWLNVMIFYHVLAHIDFFQNNAFFRHTWDYDFTGRALADKRLIASLRSEHGRWVDYVIEFARSLDNLVGYFDELAALHVGEQQTLSPRLDYYFDLFLQEVRKARQSEYQTEIRRYNELAANITGTPLEAAFLAPVLRQHPEFDACYARYRANHKPSHRDLLQYLCAESPFLNRPENRWMQQVIDIVRHTSLYFQPQIRTKIMNEGWASYWHEQLFLADPAIRGHEADFAVVNARVTAMPRVGHNPYALGLRLFQYIEAAADKGRLRRPYRDELRLAERADYDTGTGGGRQLIHTLRTELCDFTFLNSYVDQDFVDQHRLFVSGKRYLPARRSWQYYVKSRSAEAYKQMVLGQLYHPPRITLNPAKSSDGSLYLEHRFEGKPLVLDFIGSVLLGLEFFWGGKVQLETSVVDKVTPRRDDLGPLPAGQLAGPDVTWARRVYSMERRRLSHAVL